MTDTLTKVVVDCSTGEQTILPLTADEIASLELSRQEAEARKAEEDAAAEALAAVKASAKAKLVAGTPLTEEEAATLVL
jgi:formylmethanofuran dehydrogenase subunit B